MYHDEHQPAHFHARYAGKEIQVGIADGRVRGSFHPRALGLVLEWWSGGVFISMSWLTTGN